MSLENPKEFWRNISSLENWRDFILPKRGDNKFDHEGFLDANRMFYFFDNKSFVIDYGCGIGRVSKHVSDYVEKIVGLDVNLDFVEKAKRYVNKNNADFFVSNTYGETEIADFVYCLMVFQHNDKNNRDIIIKHIKELLKKNRSALIQFPKHESCYYEESSFVHKFKKEEVELYGSLFESYVITEGNLVDYASSIDKSYNHEYFLIVKK